MDASRRAFLAGVAAAAALAHGAPSAAADDDGGAKPGAAAALPMRPFGKKADRVSILGLGCFPIGALPDADAAAAILRRALEAGVTYFDTAPSYSGGQSESRLGAALKGWPREKVFVATKTHTRTASDAQRDLEGSLKRLRLKTIDLVQVHAVKDAPDLERALAADGPLAALVKAREEGLVRHIGVTGHADPQVMAQTFARWPFDSVLFPMNCIDPHHLSFVGGTLPAAVEKGIARIAMKVFASGALVRDLVDERSSKGGAGSKSVVHKATDPVKCLRYVYGLDITTAIVGCGTLEELEVALRVARDPEPLSAGEVQDLLRTTLPHLGQTVEWYKRA